MSIRFETRKSAAATRLAAACLAGLAIASPPAAAARPQGKAEAGSEVTANAVVAVREVARVPVEEQAVTTRHAIEVRGQRIAYAATAGTLTLRDKAGLPGASMFYVAYVADRPKGSKPRPLTFVYNGGPGAASIWLHMGSYGPMRIEAPAPGEVLSAPYALKANDQTLLGDTDLVFLDAISTGYSRTFDPGDVSRYWGNDQDADAFAEAIKRYLDINDRWNSTKYLFGESYGTTRSAILSHRLHEEGIDLSGVILMSSILNFAQRAPGLDRMAINHIPTYAATAWYHGKVAAPGNDVAALVAEARAFASGPYTLALAKGHAISAQEKRAVADRLAALTGISADYYLHSDLRIMPERFRKELLRERGAVIGGFDTRYEAFEADGMADAVASSPDDAAIGGAYVMLLRQYLSQELGYRTDLDYVVSNSGPMFRQWDWSHQPPAGPRQNALANVAGDLGVAMRTNPKLRVLSLNGYYDLSTPFFATEFDLSHLYLPPALQQNIDMRFYASGHMLYLEPDALVKTRDAIADFVSRDR
ncbi:peptidase S10 [Novosphingobium sp. YJ-S2-02]|uniref:Peptidase S10 n=1 Tax=Novosphingobium aureum TaxID=2792964 RepID=A0A931HAS1_9SPHN|nr:peptidase S10 [Novosphingobium aureum]MBH0112093.1 peptidase S10 [Novosphingobium aureum]